MSRFSASYYVTLGFVCQGAAFWHSPVREKGRKLMRAVPARQVCNHRWHICIMNTFMQTSY